MSCVIVVVPVVVASWPAIAGAVVSAVTALGFTVVKEKTAKPLNRTQVEVSHVEAVADTLGRGESIVVRRGEVTVTFQADARGRFAVHVDGPLDKAELARIGTQMSQAVVQHYVHRRLSQELASAGFTTVAEERAAEGIIHLRVRRYI